MVNNDYFTQKFLPLYDNFQKEFFSKSIACNKDERSFINCVYKFHNQQLPKFKYNENSKKPYFEVKQNKKVLLAYSGGLDSVYQALYLKSKGYRVTLFHIKDINRYENSQGYNRTVEFANDFDFPLVVVNHNKFLIQNKKFWPENPIKNQFIFSVMLDYCIENEIYNIASGDNYTLLAKNATIGINFTDTKECQEQFEKIISKYTNINFISLNNKTKSQELKYILKKDNSTLNYVYSCLSPGRFNQSWRNTTIAKYGINSKIIPQYMCCKCRKCSHIVLLLKYLDIIELPEDLEESLWEKLISGTYAARDFYWKNMTKSNRIKLLLED